MYQRYLQKKMGHTGHKQGHNGHSVNEHRTLSKTGTDNFAAHALDLLLAHRYKSLQQAVGRCDALLHAPLKAPNDSGYFFLRFSASMRSWRRSARRRPARSMAAVSADRSAA